MHQVVSPANNRFFNRFSAEDLETLRAAMADSYFTHPLLTELTDAVNATELDPVEQVATDTALLAWGFNVGDRVQARVRDDSVMVDEGDEGVVTGFRNRTAMLMVRFDGDAGEAAVEPEHMEAI